MTIEPGCYLFVTAGGANITSLRAEPMDTKWLSEGQWCVPKGTYTIRAIAEDYGPIAIGIYPARPSL